MPIKHIPQQTAGFTYIQDNEPYNAQDGDSWFKTGTPSAMYIRTNGIWVRFGSEV